MKKNIESVLQKQLVTEKASVIQGRGVYSFIVSDRVNKIEIKDAIVHLYKVTPKKIAIINAKPKKTRARGRSGMKSGFKKALIYLKEGDKIDIL